MATEQAGSSVRVTRDSVLEAIKAYVETQAKPFFTTQDIARFMGVEEYPVRAAVSWLTRYELIEVVPGVRSRRYLGNAADETKRRHTDSYSASVYQMKPEAAPAEVFSLLNRAFGFA